MLEEVFMGGEFLFVVLATVLLSSCSDAGPTADTDADADISHDADVDDGSDVAMIQT